MMNHTTARENEIVGRRRERIVTLLLLLLAPGHAGCDGADAPPTVSGPSARNPGRASAAGAITANGAGRARLGMRAEEVLSTYGDRARRATVTREGMADPVIRIRDTQGQLLMDADVPEGRVTRITIRSPQLATDRGIRVGSRLRELERAYGQGSVLTGEGNVCVIFPKSAAGLSFCLANGGSLSSGDRPSPWSRLIQLNLRVSEILVVGASDSEGPDRSSAKRKAP
jgi:hypothetical protein